MFLSTESVMSAARYVTIPYSKHLNCAVANHSDLMRFGQHLLTTCMEHMQLLCQSHGTEIRKKVMLSVAS